jgi:hopanoid biosynthesis associated protein HpnK
MAQAVTEAPVGAAVEPGSGEAAGRGRAPIVPPVSGQKTVIINADDFGGSPAINHAVALAHREGILTSASLMVGEAAAEHAAALARQMPRLAVGLHLVLADGKAALPAREIPHLVDGDGRFADSPTRAGMRYFFSRSARRELAGEIRAQFEKFARTGLELSHVDGHCGLHLHPVVFDLLLPMAEKHGARAVRIVHDVLGVSLAHERRGLARKLAWTTEFALLRRRAERRMDRRRWPTLARTIGLLHSGDMTEAYVLEVLDKLPAGVSALYFHPSLGPQVHPCGPGPMDLATLLSPAIRQAIEKRDIRLATFPQIALEQSATFFLQPDSGLLTCST